MEGNWKLESGIPLDAIFTRPGAGKLLYEVKYPAMNTLPSGAETVE